MRVRLCKRDCLEVMRGLGDASVVTIADPPYGIGRDWEKRDWRSRAKYRDCQYMNRRPGPEYFAEMKRVSSNWIVWGWNYFTDMLEPTNYLLVWDKMSNQNSVFRYSKCEIAGTSYRIPCNLVSLGWDGYRMGEETGTKKIHPHQKPVALYRWLLREYVAGHSGPYLRDVTVLDPFMGSGSCALACKTVGVGSYIGCEVEDMFFDAAEARIRAARGADDTITIDKGDSNGKEQHTNPENPGDQAQPVR